MHVHIPRTAHCPARSIIVALDMIRRARYPRPFYPSPFFVGVARVLKETCDERDWQRASPIGPRPLVVVRVMIAARLHAKTVRADAGAADATDAAGTRRRTTRTIASADLFIATATATTTGIAIVVLAVVVASAAAIVITVVHRSDEKVVYHLGVVRTLFIKLVHVPVMYNIP